MRSPHTSAKRLFIAAVGAMLIMAPTACGQERLSDDEPFVSELEGLDIDYRSLTATLNGSGSSFQEPLQQAVIGAFETHASSARVTYQKSGSSAGKTDLAARIVQFAGTDSVINAQDQREFRDEVMYFPIAASSITISYNLPGIDELRFTPELLAKIFQTEITRWDDPALAEVNPEVELPDLAIGVIRRSDGSGTTSNFTKYLTKAAPDHWDLGTGEAIEWPNTTQGAEKSSGVSMLIRSTDGAIGYVDLADSVASGLQRAQVQNRDGQFVEPKLPNVAAAIEGSDIAPDLTFDPLDAPGAASYPITAPTWIITATGQRNDETAQTLRGFLNFFLTEGQLIAPALGYAPLPERVRVDTISQIERITVREPGAQGIT